MTSLLKWHAMMSIAQRFTYNRVAGVLEIDRTCCGVTKDVVCVRKIKIADTDRKLKLRFIRGQTVYRALYQ